MGRSGEPGPVLRRHPAAGDPLPIQRLPARGGTGLRGAASPRRWEPRPGALRRLPQARARGALPCRARQSPAPARGVKEMAGHKPCRPAASEAGLVPSYHSRRRENRMDVVAWLLDSDPAIRWQVMRDLTDAPEEHVAAERARVATEGWGARLLALQRQNGQWDGGTPTFTSTAAAKWWQSLPPDRQGTLFPESPSTTWSLALLQAFGLDPASAGARRAVRLVREHCRWEHDGEAFFAGEVEPCINGRIVALGAYFGEYVRGIVERLLGEQMADGGWNCEHENGSTRGSFHTTINVVEGLLEHSRATGGSAEVAAALERGQEYLLERRMLRRLSSGELIDTAFTLFSFPTGYHYDARSEER